MFDAAATDLVNDQQMQMTAANNTAENFSLIFGERFQRALLERIDRNEKVVYKFQTTLSCRPRSQDLQHAGTDEGEGRLPGALPHQ